MAGKSVEGKVRCSFCNKTQDQVRKLIAGPAGVYICDECGTDEAIRGLCGNDLPLREWAIAKLHQVNR